mgnify:CR=1 FL=1
MSSMIRLLFILLFSFFISSTYAKNIFLRSTPLNLTLKINLSELLLKKKFHYWERGGKKFLDATLSYKNEDISILVQNSGDLNYYQDLPPLKFKFNHPNYHFFRGHKMLKLITHGKIKSGNISKTINNFLAYKKFNILSPFSYKVRLVKIKYVDSSKALEPFIGWGFFVEPKRKILRRFPFKSLSRKKQSRKTNFNSKQTALLHAFNFFIQDTNRYFLDDNKFFHQKADLFSFNYFEVLAIPYDFSQSVIHWLNNRSPEEINYILETSFAKKNWLKYPGLKYSELKNAFRLIYNKRTNFENLYLNKSLPLNKKERKAYINYLDHFFKFLKNRI